MKKKLTMRKASVSEARAGLIPSEETDALLPLPESEEESKKPYALVTVYGGVADLVIAEGGASVDILDYDNMKSTGPEDLSLSDREWEYLREHSPEEFAFFAPSFVKRND
jgi:hypothetical protein